MTLSINDLLEQQQQTLLALDPLIEQELQALIAHDAEQIQALSEQKISCCKPCNKAIRRLRRIPSAASYWPMIRVWSRFAKV